MNEQSRALKMLRTMKAITLEREPLRKAIQAKLERTYLHLVGCQIASNPRVPHSPKTTQGNVQTATMSPFRPVVRRMSYVNKTSQ